MSSKNAYRWNANRMGTEQDRMDGERIRNGHGMDTERIQNRYRTDTEQTQNGNRNACGTETERVLSSIPC